MNKTIYIVRRPFRNYGSVLTVGTVISDPTVIKRFKSLIGEGKILALTEQELPTFAKFLNEKYGVDVIIPAEPAIPIEQIKKEEQEAKKVTSAKLVVATAKVSK